MKHWPLLPLVLLGLLTAGCSDPAGDGKVAAPAVSNAPVTMAPAPTPARIVGRWQPAGTDDTLAIVGDRPQLTAAGRKLFDAHRAAAARGVRDWDGTRRCLPPGTPRIMTIAQPFDIDADAHLVAMTFQYQGLVRLIHMDDAYGIAGKPGFMGESHGHWEGNSLVVETRNFRSGTVLDGTGWPHGAKLVVSERIEPQDDDTLVDHITLSDAEMYLRPWQAQVTLRRQPEARIEEDVCVERTGLQR